MSLSNVELHIVDELSMHVPPPFTGSAETIAVNSFGDVCVLCEDGLRMTNLRDAPSAAARGAQLIQVVDEAGKDANIKGMQFQYISFNTTGNALLLWNARHVAVVIFPKSVLRGGAIRLSELQAGSSQSRCFFKVLYTIPQLDVIDGGKVAKAAFHLYSPNHVLVLTVAKSGSQLELIDVVPDDLSLGELHQPRWPMRYPLLFIDGDHFVSFACGPNIDWLRFTVFLLTSGGRIYALCPVVPPQTAIEGPAIAALWAWHGGLVENHARALEEEEKVEQEVDEEEREQDDDDGSRYANALTRRGRLPSALRGEDDAEATYLHQVREYLVQTFGPPISDMRYGSGLPDGRGLVGLLSHSPQLSPLASDVIRPTDSGELTAISGISGALPLPSAPGGIHRVQLQPVKVSFPADSGSQQLASALAASGRLRDRGATDLTFVCSAVDGSGIPIVAIAFDSGDVVLGILAPNTENAAVTVAPLMSHWMRGKWFSNQAEVLIAETVVPSHGFPNTIPLSAWKGAWRLKADPVNPYYIHMWCGSNGHTGSYILSSSWVQRVLSSFPIADDNFTAVLQSEATDVIPVQVDSKSIATGSSHLAGYQVVRDAFLGHSVVFRLTTGQVGLVNVKVHTRCYELSNEAKKRTVKTDTVLAGFEEHWALQQDERTFELIIQIDKARADIPKPLDDIDVEQQHQEQTIKELKTASDHIGREIILPMDELSQILIYRTEIMGRIQEEQSKLIGTSSLDKPGLIDQLKILEQQHDESNERLKSIQSRYEDQKEQLNVILRKLKKVSALRRRQQQLGALAPADSGWVKELDDWNHQLKSMNDDINAVRQQQQLRKFESHLAKATPVRMDLRRSPMRGAGDLASPGPNTPGTVGTTDSNVSSSMGMRSLVKALPLYSPLPRVPQRRVPYASRVSPSGPNTNSRTSGDVSSQLSNDLMTNLGAREFK